MKSILLAAVLPLAEMEMIGTVASEYGLDREQTALLVAIRRFENGRPGLEFGVGELDTNHPAHRYTDGKMSFLVQDRWAAGTIRKRYRGDLRSFARRYCPANAEAWERGVRSIMSRVLKEVR